MKTLILILISFCLFSFIPDKEKREYKNNNQCKGITLKKERCKNYSMKNDSLCYIHRKKESEKKK